MAKKIPAFTYTGQYSTMNNDSYWYIFLTTSGTLTFTYAKTSIDVGCVGGGGSSTCIQQNGNPAGGSGGGGGYLSSGTSTVKAKTGYTITVGVGGAAPAAWAAGNNGGTTSAFGISAAGGKGAGKMGWKDSGTPGAGTGAGGRGGSDVSASPTKGGDGGYVLGFGPYGGGGGGGGGRKPTVTIPDDVPTGLNGDDHYAYIVGYPNGNVEPNGNITRAEVATIFFRLLTEEVRTANSTQSNSLSDVTRGQWFNHAVSTLSSMGIVKGHNDGTFAPNAPITRAEFAAIAARFDDKNTDTSSKFTDIASHWAKNEIGIAANKGWINGYPDGTFRPNQYITRAEAMTLVNRVLNRLPENSSDLLDSMIKWPDNADASVWYYLAVQEATNSHAYSDKSKDDKYEKWTTIRETRDWTELEK